MLVWFRCKNFSSFKDEAILDMRAVKSYKEHPYNLIIQDDKDDLIKVASIYGANASGKSNFVGAYSNFRNIIQNSFQNNNKENEQESVLEENYFPFFLNSKSKNGDTEFEAVVREEGKEYQYGFVYNQDEIKEEWLYKRSSKNSYTTKIFERKQQQIDLGASVKQACEKYKDAIDKDVLALSFFSSLNLKNQVFKSAISNMIGILPIDSSETMEQKLLDRYCQYVFNEEEKLQLLAFIKAIDVGIVDIEVIQNQNNRTYEIFLFHLNEKNEKQRFHMSLESAGTIKAISLYTVMKMAATFNKGIIIDEFNTKLHPLLQKYLIDRFYDGTESGQLIYTTHDTCLLDKSYMRRDQIWFVEKNDRGESSLFSLSEFKVRNDRSFEKDYLGGVYGAIPILKDFSFTEA